MGISQPRKYVLKPQREGGGNNFYDDNIRQQLEKVSNSKDRTAWILMDRIYPPVQKNYLIRADSKENDILHDVVSELGIFGVIIGYVLFLKYIISDTFICNQYLFVTFFTFFVTNTFSFFFKFLFQVREGDQS